jgi:hypothetical protein
MAVNWEASSFAKLVPDFLAFRAPSTRITTGPLPTASYAIFVPSFEVTNDGMSDSPSILQRLHRGFAG